MSDRATQVWREPVRGGFPEREFFRLHGRDQMEAHLRGHVVPSPVSRLFGVRLTQTGSGSATFSLRAGPWLQLPDGTLDLCILADLSMRAAAMSVAPPATEVRGVALSINHLRPFGLDGEALVARGRLVHTGRTFTLCETLLEDSLGRSVAHASEAMLLVPIDTGDDTAPYRPSPYEEPVHPSPHPYLRPPPRDRFPFELWRDDARLMLDRLVEGDLPPVPGFCLTGLRILGTTDGGSTVAMPATEWLASPYRTLYSGALAHLSTIAMTAAALSRAPAGSNVGIVEQAVSFTRTVPADGGDLVARARVVDGGSDVTVVTGEVTDAAGRQVALGHQTSVMTTARRPGGAARPTDRMLATVLFTDIVGSTELAQRLGDDGWKRLLHEHDAVVRRALLAYKGREVKTTGDGFLATFDAAARAVRCACAARDDLRATGVEIRAGIHVGEVEIGGGDIGGIAVHIAQRVLAEAQPGEVLVSATTRDAVAGAGIEFTERGSHVLKGVDGEWRLYAVQAG